MAWLVKVVYQCTCTVDGLIDLHGFVHILLKLFQIDKLQSMSGYLIMNMIG